MSKVPTHDQPSELHILHGNANVDNPTYGRSNQTTESSTTYADPSEACTEISHTDVIIQPAGDEVIEDTMCVLLTDVNLSLTAYDVTAMQYDNITNV